MSLMILSAVAHADFVPGVDNLVGESEIVAIVRALPPADHQDPSTQRVAVVEVLKGFWPVGVVAIAGRPLAVGQRAVILPGVAALPNWNPTVNLAPALAAPPPLLWPLTPSGAEEMVAVGELALVGSGMRGLPHDHPPLTLTQLKALIATACPEEAGLHGRVLDAALFDHVSADPLGRAIAAVRNFPRDVQQLAPLLEVEDAAVWRAAAHKLTALCGDVIVAPNSPDAHARQSWSDAWLRWWQANRGQLRWKPKATANGWHAHRTTDPPARGHRSRRAIPRAGRHSPSR